MTTRELCGISGLLRLLGVRALSAAVTLVFALTSTSLAATITVNSLKDTGASGICVLRDAITAAKTKTATNGCAAGSGNDQIRFGITGTITLTSTLPKIMNGVLAINGPASPGITIDGGDAVQVLMVGAGSTVELKDLTISNGLSAFEDGGTGGGIRNDGTLSVTNCVFSGNTAEGCDLCGAGGAIFNDGRLAVTKSQFSDNQSSGFSGGGGIENQGKLLVASSSFSGNFGHDGGGIDNAGLLDGDRYQFS